MRTIDPRSPDLEDFLTGLPPRKELLTRMAMREVYDHCRSDRRWHDRLNELMEGITPHEMSDILDEADKLAERLRTETGSPAYPDDH